MKKVSLLLLAFSFCFSLSIFGQPGDPGGGGPPTDIPIGALEVLLLLGAGLGARKVLRKEK